MLYVHAFCDGQVRLLDKEIAYCTSCGMKGWVYFFSRHDWSENNLYVVLFRNPSDYATPLPDSPNSPTEPTS